MPVIAEFSVAPDDFLLGRVLGRHSETTVEMDRIVPVPGDVMPYVWVFGPRFDGFEDAVRRSVHVEDAIEVDSVGESTLYRIDWSEHTGSLLYGLSKANATVLQVRGTDVWSFRVRFDVHADLRAFSDFCRDRDIAFELDRLYAMTDERQGNHGFELTATQRNALVVAVEEGYFEVPRRATLTDLGERLGVSDQTVSENLRRGVSRVLNGVLTARPVGESER